MEIVKIKTFIYKYFPFLSSEFYLRLGGYFFRIPTEWKFVELTFFLISMFCCQHLFRKGKIKKSSTVRYSLLTSYMFFVIISTVLARNSLETYTYNFVPFQSYFEWLKAGNMDLFWENLYNIMMFIPIGLLLNPEYKRKNIIVFGVGFSCSIEILQLFMMRGTCELDDVINNMIGFIFGMLVSSIVMFSRHIVIEKAKGRRDADQK